MTTGDYADGDASAKVLRDLHAGPGPLVVPNAFDAASARVLERAGFATVATSSAAMAWTAGARDGETLTFDAALELHGRVARAVEVPVSVDFEGGYLEGSRDVERTVHGLLEAGIAGLNLEDTDFPSQAALHDVRRHADLIAATRAAADREGVDLFVIGRTDVFFREVGPAGRRVDEAAQRLRAYAEAGADCAFAPGVADEADIAQLVESLPVPLNTCTLRAPRRSAASASSASAASPSGSTSTSRLCRPSSRPRGRLGTPTSMRSSARRPSPPRPSRP